MSGSTDFSAIFGFVSFLNSVSQLVPGESIQSYRTDFQLDMGRRRNLEKCFPDRDPLFEAALKFLNLLHWANDEGYQFPEHFDFQEAEILRRKREYEKHIQQLPEALRTLQIKYTEMSAEMLNEVEVYRYLTEAQKGKIRELLRPVPPELAPAVGGAGGPPLAAQVSVSPPAAVKRGQWVHDFCEKIRTLNRSSRDFADQCQEIIHIVNGADFRPIFYLMNNIAGENKYADLIQLLEAIQFDPNEKDLQLIKSAGADLEADLSFIFTEETLELGKLRAFFLDEYYRYLRLTEKLNPEATKAKIAELCAEKNGVLSIAQSWSLTNESTPICGTAKRYVEARSLEDSAKRSSCKSFDEVFNFSEKTDEFDRPLHVQRLTEHELWGELLRYTIDNKKILMILLRVATYYPEFAHGLLLEFNTTANFIAAHPFEKEICLKNLLEKLCSSTTVEMRFMPSLTGESMIKPLSLRAFFVQEWVNQVKQVFPKEVITPEFQSTLIRWATDALLFPEFDQWIKREVIKALSQHPREISSFLLAKSEAIEYELARNREKEQWSVEELDHLSESLSKDEIRTIFVAQKCEFLSALQGLSKASQDENFIQLREILAGSLFYRGSEESAQEIRACTPQALKRFLSTALNTCFEDRDIRVLQALRRTIDSTVSPAQDSLLKAILRAWERKGRIFAFEARPDRGYWAELMGLRAQVDVKIESLEAAAPQMQLENPEISESLALLNEVNQARETSAVRALLTALDDKVEKNAEKNIQALRGVLRAFWKVFNEVSVAVIEKANLDVLKDQLLYTLDMVVTRNHQDEIAQFLKVLENALVNGGKERDSLSLLGRVLRLPTDSLMGFPLSTHPNRGRWLQVCELNKRALAQLSSLAQTHTPFLRAPLLPGAAASPDLG